MFTGLVEEVGKIRGITRDHQFGKFEITAKLILEDIKIGDSIAVNGTCLTAVAFSASSFIAEAMRETLEKTALGFLQTGSSVNLERALLPTTRLGGHFVSGHVDGMGTLVSKTDDGPAKMLKFTASSEILRQMISKGSIAIDGVSLTLIEVASQYFTVGIIPHTQSASTLTQIPLGTKVNLETDLLGKYCQKFVSEGLGRGRSDTLEKLVEFGF